MRGLRSDYLENVARNFLKNFHGVMPCDWIGNFDPKVSDSVIINLSPSTDAGSHFVALHYDRKQNHFTYFDSFGMPCSNQYIIKYITSKKQKSITFSAQQIQEFSSLFCGYYALSFLISRQNDQNLSSFLSMFEKNELKKNEEICISYIKEMILNK